MYAQTAPLPVFGGEYRVEQAEPLFAGVYEVAPGQPLLAGLDPYDYPALRGVDKSDYPSLGKITRPMLMKVRGMNGFGELTDAGSAGVGTAVGVGVGVLVLGAAVSFGLSVLASYTGARLAGCKRQ